MEFRIEHDLSRLSELSDQADRVMERVFENVTALMIGELKEVAPVDHGRLASSFMFEKLSPVDFRVYSTALYALYAMETGRGPGRPPPFETIERWAMRKGLGDAARQIWLTITAEGTWLYRHGRPYGESKPYGTDALDRVEERIDEVVETALAEIR